RDALSDPRVVDADAVVAAEILDVDFTVVAEDARVTARHVPLGEPDGVAFLAPDRDLVADQRDLCCLSLVILDHKLEHRRMRPRSSALRAHVRWLYQSKLLRNNCHVDYLVPR